MLTRRLACRLAHLIVAGLVGRGAGRAPWRRGAPPWRQPAALPWGAAAPPGGDAAVAAGRTYTEARCLCRRPRAAIQRAGCKPRGGGKVLQVADFAASTAAAWAGGQQSVQAYLDSARSRAVGPVVCRRPGASSRTRTSSAATMSPSGRRRRRGGGPHIRQGKISLSPAIAALERGHQACKQKGWQAAFCQWPPLHRPRQVLGRRAG